ncbi:MAG TPA: glycosyltransferase family 39 protein [Tepidisphaeraceae bacterium]|nr:glycosyltransferase family 39 protein [Tepidisphaeraceae bacterium]
MSRATQFGLLLLACAALYLVGNNTVPLWDRDEPRYANASRWMMQSGDWVVPRIGFGDQPQTPRTAKPVLIYWLQAGAMGLFGATGFAARFPSAIAMLVTIVVLFFALGRTRRAFWTVVIFATSGLTIAAAKMALTDSVLLMFVTISQLCVYAMWRGRANLFTWIVYGIAVGLAGLTKGPVVLGVNGMTLLVLWGISSLDRFIISYRQKALGDSGGVYLPRKARSFTSLRMTNIVVGVCIALAIIAAICVPWLLAVQHRAPEFLKTIIGHDVIERVQTGLEGHKGPPGYYLILIWATYFPWSLLLPATVVQAFANRRIPQIRFALAAVIGPWVMFEIVQTKLPHYLLPIFPPLAFLTGDMLIRASRKRIKDMANIAFVRVAFGWAILVALLASAPWIAIAKFKFSQAMLWPMVVLSLLGIEWGRQVWLYFRGNKPLDAAAVMGIGMIGLIGVLYGWYLPTAKYMQISPAVADILKNQGATRPGDVIMIDYKEPTLAFYQGGTIQPERDNDYLQNNSPQKWPNWIVTTTEVWHRTPEDLRAKWEVIDQVHGWSYADGSRILDVLVAKKKDK